MALTLLAGLRAVRMGASRRVSRQASDRRIFAEYSTPQPLAEDRSDEYFETPYLLAPNVKQRFLATLPGAVLAVGCWIGLSYLLGIYFRHDGLVVLDRFCHAGGSGTQCGTGQDKQRRQAATKARTSCDYKIDLAA